MLFNSFVFLFAFAPMSILGFYVCGRFGDRMAQLWLILVSFVFYGWWSPSFIALLIISIFFNAVSAEMIARHPTRPRLQSSILVLAVTANLLALFCYKYLEAILHGLVEFGVVDGFNSRIVLPLGISFFTFTQIGYLVDVRQGVARDRGILNYILFVTFFPHLIAGPILHNREIMPQFGSASTYRFSADNLAAGLSIFVLGLLKKCLLADPLARVAAAGYGSCSHVTWLAAWDAVLSFSLQLYFDFSGYSDMAIGLARMFNVEFPLNFNSPYKAASIIDHWRRWHMTLSRYLALYLYNPMAMSIARWRTSHGLKIGREGSATLGGFASMVALPILVTMGLAGIWHGAGLQYLVFGVLHGVYLVVNHLTRLIRHPSPRPRAILHVGKVALTYLCVLVASVFFRSPSVSDAISMLAAMVGLHGAGALVLPNTAFDWLMTHHPGVVSNGAFVAVSSREFSLLAFHLAWLLALFGIIWGFPNTQDIISRYKTRVRSVDPSMAPAAQWKFSRGWAVAMGVAGSLGVLAIGGTSEFLYFQF